MINGVIFDMDGTMFDTERMWATFWDPALKALGLPYKEGLAEAARGTAGETTRNVVRSFYGPDCDADGIVESLHRVADEVFLSAPVPKKPGLDALLAWLDEQHLPMAVASSSREAMIRNNLDQWGMTHYFKAIVSGQHVAHSKPDPEICFLADMGDFAAFNEVYAKYFTSKPARSCVAVKTLPKNVLCEIEATAEL